MTEPMMDVLDLSAEGSMTAGPLQFTFPLAPSVVIVTDVYGPGRSQATVTIKSGTMPVWTGSMNQVSDVATVDYDLLLGSLNIKKGMMFKLTIPTESQNGNVFMQGEVQSPPNPWKPVSAIIAIWPLNSAA